MRRAVLIVIAIAGCRGPNAATADGSLPDAALPDAAVPDAAVPDAAHPDAAIPDGPVADAALPDASPDGMPDAMPPDASLGSIVVAPLAFGAQQARQVTRASTTVTNEGSTSAAIHRIHVTGNTLLVLSTTCGASLAAGATCQVSIELYASTAGMIDETLAVDTNLGTGSGPVTAFTTYGLRVDLEGSGTGHVTSSPAGINCPGTCSANFAATTSVTLTATPDAGTTFRGWVAPGCGTSPTCVVNVSNPNASAAALFLLPTDRLLQIELAGNAPIVWSARSQSTSIGYLDADAPYTLVAAVGTMMQLEGNSPSVWAGMTGACATTSHLCSFTVTTDSTVTMTANLGAHEVLDVLTWGTGGRDSVNTDGNGNLYAIGSGLMTSSDSAGNLRWTRPRAGTVLIAPDDEVLVAGSELDWLDANGDIATAVAWVPGTAPASVPDADFVARPYAMAPNGNVVRVDGMSLQEYSKAGLVWSVDLPMRSLPVVSVGDDGTIALALTAGVGPETGPVYAWLADSNGASLSSFEERGRRRRRVRRCRRRVSC